MKKRFTLFVTLALLFASQANAQYCYQYWYNYGGCYIDNVTFGTINNSSSYQYYGGYDDYSYLSTSVYKGLSYDLTIKGYSWWGDNRFKVWIDWNDDKTFSASEVVYDMQYSATSNSTPYTQSISIPATAVSGNVRMRIVYCPYWENYVLDDICSYGTYGYNYVETEDYTVTIIQPPAIDLDISAVTPEVAKMEQTRLR